MGYDGLGFHDCVMLSLWFRRGATPSAENQANVTPLVMAAQNKCTDAFQLLMDRMDQPIETIFKMMDLTVDHGQILMVSYGKVVYIICKNTTCVYIAKLYKLYHSCNGTA